MQFGIYIRSGVTYLGMLALAKQADDLGYYGIFLNDHIQGLSKEGIEPYIEAWTTMSALGVQTKKVKLGHITLFNSLRNPAFLAKSIATLDNISNGRYELILGAGWNEPEYIGYDLMERGRGMPSAGERVSRLKESVQILKLMLNDEVVDYEGNYWKLKNAINIPQPVQKPFRVSVGARQPRMIKIAANFADGINASGNLKNVEKILSNCYPALEKAGKKIEDYFISGFAPSTHLLKDESEYENTLKRWAKRGINPEHAKEYEWIGTSEFLIKKFRRALDMGMKMCIINVRPSETLKENIEMLALFKDEVASQI